MYYILKQVHSNRYLINYHIIGLKLETLIAISASLTFRQKYILAHA